MNKPEVVDNTMITTFLECPRRYALFMSGVEESEVPTYFDTGRAWHKALAWLYTTGKDSPIEDKEAKGLEIFLSLGNKEGRDIDHPLHNVEVWKLYLANYPTVPWSVLKAEVGFVLPLAGTSIMVGGALDGYLVWGSKRYVLENKTTGSPLGQSWLSRWNRDRQVTTYTWALRSLTGGGEGVLVNGISLAKSATIRFVQDLQIRDKSQVQEWEDETRYVFGQMERACQQGEWPKLGRWCWGGNGISPCPYRWLCREPLGLGETLKRLPRNLYNLRTGPWEPWKREGSECAT